MKKEHLIRHIEAMTPEQLELLGDLLNYASFPYDNGLFYKLCGVTEEEKRKIDSAYPCDYAKSIKEIYPDFQNGHHCYDYNVQSFGSMRNLNNSFVKNIREKLKLETL